MDESLWPARNVAEHAYCPRLFYYMQVEGVFVPSSDTEKGRAIHRRVDKPSATREKPDENEADPDRPKVVRSLGLTSESLGLTATLDLAEISGQTAVPVEHRKGRPKRAAVGLAVDDHGQVEQSSLSHPEAWPTDRIQVGLQAILLECAGYVVPEAVIYYAEEKLRLRVTVDDALKAEALETLESAKQCAEGPRPLPLVNDPRCPRCSLEPICLPDEVNHQRAESPANRLTPRKIWPPRDDGIHVVAQQEGVTRLVALIDPLDSVSAEVRRSQIRELDDMEVCLELARALVSAKITNQRTLLLRNHCSPPAGVAANLG